MDERPKTLPDDFRFSQSSLQDFVDCQRRFQLRYIWRLAWPAIQSEPVLENERYMRQGASFHQMVHQHLLGVPAERLGALIQDEDLTRWWNNYLSHAEPRTLVNFEKITGIYPEISLSAPLGTRRLVAKFDLVLLGDGDRAAIVDWKSARKLPRRGVLSERLQTRVYLYLLPRAGEHLNAGQPLLPGGVEMIYWFSDYPEQAARFSYSQEQYRADEVYLEDLVSRILDMDQDVYPLTSDEKRCAYCVYRSLCERGVGAAHRDEIDADLDEDAVVDFILDFEQIAEIEF